MGVARPRRGFTLIELLVVVAIIAVLAALLFPVFSRARESARAAQCASNLKQISSALHLYMDAWDGRLSVKGKQVSLSLAPYLSYLRSKHVLRCPSNPAADMGEAEYLSYLKEGRVHYRPYMEGEFLGFSTPISYRLNLPENYVAVGDLIPGRVAEDSWNDCDVVGFAEQQHCDPSRLILVDEAIQDLGYPRSKYLYWGDHKAVLGYWHGGWGNYLFLDGHVRCLPLSATLAPTNLWFAQPVPDIMPSDSVESPYR
ncbi:MAG TPA: prepilin-type N-terminal cleavage/methylation domain-containing protein [Armatimonadota bacterium]